MSRIAVVGGHGKIALLLHPLLRDAGHEPLAIVRSDEHRAELEGQGVHVRLVDLERQDADALAEAFAGCAAVVFSAGGGADGNAKRKRTVDLEGSTKSAEGARLAGVERFVQVSAIGVDDPLPEDTDDVWRAYVEAKRDADAALRETSLAWTILRPGRLTDDSGTGRVVLGDRVQRGAIPRADVAATIVACLADDRSVRRQWELVSGDVPVADAVAAG